MIETVWLVMQGRGETDVLAIYTTEAQAQAHADAHNAAIAYCKVTNGQSMAYVASVEKWPLLTVFDPLKVPQE